MLTIACEQCGSAYDLDESLIPPSGVVMKCPECAAAISVMPPVQTLDPDDFFAPATPMLPQSFAPLVNGPALSAFDAGDEDVLDVLAPQGPPQEIVDLPAPKGPLPTRGFASEPDQPELPVPVGPLPTKSLPDLLAPVGPLPTKSIPDLLTPVGPVPTRSVPDLLTPVGPFPTRGASDLPTPVGPLPSPGLPKPVGPVATRELLAPVGPVPSPAVPEPVGPIPTGNLPAPRGFFDEPPPPTPAFAPGPPQPPALDLDDLDLLPAGAGAVPQDLPPLSLPPLDLGLPEENSIPPAQTAAPAGFALDAFDLLPPEPASSGGGQEPASSPSFGEVDLPPTAEDEGASVVSFARPSKAAAAAELEATSARGGDDLLDLGAAGPAPVEAPEAPRAGGPAEQASATGQAAAAPSPVKARRRKLWMAGAATFLACAAAAIYVKMRMDAAAAQERTIALGLAEARKLLGSDQRGHWDAAAKAVDKVLRVKAKHPEALGLAAQAQLAAALDEGRNREARLNSAGVILDGPAAALSGPELDKATALRKIFDEKGDDAKDELAALLPKLPADADLSLYLGWAALSAGDAAGAKKAFDQALGKNPKRIATLYGRGQAELALGQRDAAKATFEKVRDFEKGGHVGAAVYLAELLPHDRAGTREKRFLEIVASDQSPDTDPRALSRAWMFAADEALADHRPDEAVARYGKARNLDDANIDAAAGLGTASLDQGRKQEARSLFEYSLQKQSTNVRARLGFVRLLLAEGDVASALTHIKVALERAKNDWQPHHWHGQVIAATATGTALAAAEAAFRKAIAIIEERGEERFEPYIALSQLLNRDEWRPPRKDEAKKILDPIRAAAEGEAYLANVLGMAHLGAGDAGEAQRWFESALSKEPQNAEIRSNLAAAMDAQGNVAVALAQHEQAWAAAPESESIGLRLAYAYFRAKRSAEAQALYEKLLDESNGRKPSVPAKAAAGRFFAAKGDAARAALLGQQIQTEDPRHAAGPFLRGIGLLAQGKPLEAQKLLAEAAASDDDPFYLEGLARAYEVQKLYDDALTRFGQALERDPRYTAPMMGRARIRLARREWSRALEDLQVAVTIDPEVAEIHMLIGDCHFELSRRQDAVAAYEAALVRDPDFAEAHFKLGRVLYEMNQPGASIASLKRAVAAPPADATWLPEAFRMLGFNHKTEGHHTEMCTAFERYMELAPTNAAPRKDIKQILLGCH